MAGDLEKFLQQAAERLAQKVNQAQNPPRRPSSPPPTTPPPRVRSAERAPPRFEPEIVEAEIIDSLANRRELGPDPLSNIDTRAPLAREISLADEKMSDHLHEVFDHEVMHLKKASAGFSQSKSETDKSINLERREHSVSPLVDMLRQPATLRAAFIAGEIFKRKF